MVSPSSRSNKPTPDDTPDDSMGTLGLHLVLLMVLESVLEHLTREEAWRRAAKGARGSVFLEVLLFNFDRLERLLCAWLGDEKGVQLTTGLVTDWDAMAFQAGGTGLEELHARLVKKKWSGLLDLGIRATRASSLLTLYEKAKAEYGQYSEDLKPGKGLRGTLLWEFGNKIARMLGREEDLELIMKVQFLGTAYTYYTDVIRRLLAQEGGCPDHDHLVTASKIARELADDRRNWFDTVLAWLEKAIHARRTDIEIVNRSLAGTGEVAVKGYQLLLVARALAGREWASPSERDDLARVLWREVCGADSEALRACHRFYRRYMAIADDGPQQMIRFIQDVLTYVAGEPVDPTSPLPAPSAPLEGLLIAFFAPTVSVLATTTRMIVAHAFGDQKTLRELESHLEDITKKLR